MNPNQFTPTQLRILTLLSDGLPHSRWDIHALLWDEQSNIKAIKAHITALRKVLRPRGEDIVCELKNTRCVCYRHVRLLASAADGKR